MGKYLIRSCFILHFTFFILQYSFSQSSVQTFSTIPGISIRALYAVNDSEAWFAANRGVWGYTEDAGKTWHIDSIKVDSIVPEFRGIEVLNDSTVLLMGIASPGFILKTTNKGKTWKIVYRNDHKDIFFDSMKFKDDENGMVIADPIHCKIPILKTIDGGSTWTEYKFESSNLHPELLIYASSNTNVDWIKNNIWFVTGGWAARVYFSIDDGVNYDFKKTPLPDELQMSGIYSVDFWNKKLGVIGGGIYDRAEIYIPILALTIDGGYSWKTISISPPMFGSCVQFKNKNEIFVTGKPGTFSYNLKKEKATFIKDEKGNDIGFHTLRISPSKKVVWLAGGDGMIGRMDLRKQ